MSRPRTRKATPPVHMLSVGIAARGAPLCFELSFDPLHWTFCDPTVLLESAVTCPKCAALLRKHPQVRNACLVRAGAAEEARA